MNVKITINMTDLPFTSLQFKEIWEEWLQYRKEQKFPSYKPTGLKRTLNALVEDSGNDENEAIKMILYAMAHTWRGIFKISNNGNYVQPGAKSTVKDRQLTALKGIIETGKAQFAALRKEDTGT